MLAKLLLLTTLALVQGDPQGRFINSNLDYLEYHPDCPDDQSHYLLPHEYDCTKFYYCEYGLKWKQPRNCAPGTEFSYELQVCVHPNEANCNLPGFPTESPPEDASPTPSAQPTTGQSLSPSPVVPTMRPTRPPIVTSEPPIIVLPTDPPVEVTTEPVVDLTTVTTEESVATKPTQLPTVEPTTELPIVQPTDGPVAEPTEGPVAQPTEGPIAEPTEGPVAQPTEGPIAEPTEGPVAQPTEGPIAEPTEGPVAQPTEGPIAEPTEEPVAPSTDGPTDQEFLPNGCPADFEKYFLLPHEECNKFYYCDFGEKVERVCPSGTYFNDERKACDWPWNVECANWDSGESNPTTQPEEESSTAPPTAAPTDAPANGEWLPNGCPADFDVHQLLPHEDDCGKFYYCVFGEKVERFCPSGLHFNPAIQVCDWPWNVDCETSGNDNNPSTQTTAAPTEAPTAAPSETPTAATTQSPTQTPTEAPTVAPTEASTETPNDGEWLPNGCPADFDVHHLLPHEEDCGKFYYCVFGEKIERTCPSGLHFNPAIQVCDWPWNVDCETSGNDNNPSTQNTAAPTESPTAAPTQSPTEAPTVGPTEASSEAPENGEWLPNGCPADFDIHHLLPHEEDCGKFYYCVFGEKVERTCPSGLHFNPAIQVCDWPWNVDCATSDNGNNLTTQLPTQEPSQTTTAAPTEAPTAAPTAPTDELEWLPNGCPTDFDVHHLLPHEEDCGKFYYCVFGEKVERTCPPGLHFNPAIQVCDWPWNVDCETSDNDPSTQPPEEDPSVATTTTTPAGNTTDAPGNVTSTPETVATEAPTTQAPITNATTPAGNTTDAPGNVTLTPETVATETPTTQAPITNTTTPAGNTTDAPGNVTTAAPPVGGDNETAPNPNEPNHSKCVDECNVRPWAHATACDKFWRCEGDKAVLIVCSEGLHFNANTGTCDFICYANCERNRVQTTSHSQGLSIFVPWNKVDKDMIEVYESM